MKHKEKPLTIIGRKKEQKMLQAVFQSDKSELLAVYGRRRVGKTFLLTTFLKQKGCVFFSLFWYKEWHVERTAKRFCPTTW
jgi:AAA+ ATPase superfamily predicted ATPase